MDVLMTSTHFKFTIAYTYVENQLKLEIIELQPVVEQYGDVAIVNQVSDEDLQPKRWNNKTLNNE